MLLMIIDLKTQSLNHNLASMGFSQPFNIFCNSNCSAKHNSLVVQYCGRNYQCIPPLSDD